MSTETVRMFQLPDTIAALPPRPFEFSAAGRDAADALLGLPPAALFHRMLADQESEGTQLAARRVLHAFLSGPDTEPPADAPPADAVSADGIAEDVAAVRAELAGMLSDTLTGATPEVTDAVLRQRAPLGLLGGCWLDVLSQPATQPSVIVNRLVAHDYARRGAGDPERAVHRTRRRALEHAGITLPSVAAGDFLARCRARPLTALHALFYLALSRLPANFLPEVVGVHYAFHALGVDDVLSGLPPVPAEPELRAALAAYLDLAGPAERDRLARAVRLTVALEREHVALLAELAGFTGGLSLESRMAEIVARHAPMAGSQHRQVRVGGARLADTFADPDLDLAAFLRDFRESPQLRRTPDGGCRFLQAIKFGGPMFGIFDEREAEVFRAWIASVQAGERPEIEIAVNRVGDGPAARRRGAIAAAVPPDVVIAEAAPADHRELFHRLVNIENFPNTLPLAASRTEKLLDDAEILFEHGAAGRYTDASWFEYSPEALYERGERVYWDKLVNPYKPLEEIPSRDEVVFNQKTMALGALIDGAWIHRTANLGRFDRDGDAMLYSIYADEMGHGDLAKNHLTLIHTVLASMDVRMPHIREDAFMDQDELPDELYGFSLHQLCMAQFPDRFYNEILGYNFAIEMFGLGELRMHEMQKLHRYGFDDCYERAHLTIDNYSAGHTRQAADIIVTHLDGVRRTVGEAAVRAQWRRVWRGYASFAWFVEHALLKRVAEEREHAEQPEEIVI